MARYARAMPAHLLLVDDDAMIRDHLADLLQRQGMTVSTAPNGTEALRLLRAGGIDLVVLDVIMPGLDGREVLRRMRSTGNDIPVILLTTVGESFERALALDEGADDYLNKPFDPGELLARIRAVLRRRQSGAATLRRAERLVSGPLHLDRLSRRASLDGRPLTLTPKAFQLLEFLMLHPDEVFTRSGLLEAVWGFEAVVATRACDHRISEIRRVCAGHEAIETIPSVGYRFLGTVFPG